MPKNSTPGQPERKIVAWEDPPPQTAGSIYQPIADELREHPGAWARLDDRFSESAAQAFASFVRNGKVSAFKPAGEFEARHAGKSVWVRHIGAQLPAPGTRSFIDPQAVRLWARRHGIAVADQGRVPQRIMEAYEAGDPELAFT
jgi:hypothetical protein